MRALVAPPLTLEGEPKITKEGRGFREVKPSKYIGKIGIICLVLTLCLAAIGVGYGQWTKTLLIDGTVETGDVSVEFLNAVATDDEEPYVPGTPDVGTTTVSLADTDGDLDMDEMTVTQEYGYFCYWGFVNVDVHNNGTVPVEVVAITITEPINGEVEVSLVGLAVGDTLDVGQSVPVILMAHVATNTTGNYAFSVDIDVCNYNEADTWPPGEGL